MCIASIAISCFHACVSSRAKSNKGCVSASSGGYIIAHNIHSLSGDSVSLGGAIGYISNLILTKGCSSFTDRLSEEANFSIRELSMTSD